MDSKMNLKTEMSLPERIIALQKQLKIAIQNHQLILQRKQLLQNRDDKIKPNLEIIEFIIINIGRAQASLLNQYRNEIAARYNYKPHDSVVTDIMKSSLAFHDVPKNIPVYKSNTLADNENKKNSASKPKLKSVLKVNNKETPESDKNRPALAKLNGSCVTSVDGAKVKCLYGKRKGQSSPVVQQAKHKLQSILRPKTISKKVEKVEKVEKVPTDGNESPVSISSGESKESSPRPIDEVDLTYSPPPPSKMDTRYGKKYEGKILTTAKTKSSESIITAKKPVNDIDLKDQDEWIPFPTAPIVPTRSLALRQLDENPLTIDELNQETFLGLFCLVSKAKCEVLKRKRCERKRRSVAGQNSMYSDYLQPQPKRTYAPRKPAAPIVPANSNAVIVESSPADDDDDEKEKPVCVICHEGAETAQLESCYGCNETFHVSCLPPNQKEICPSPNCMAQRTISNIVGTDMSPGSASDLELVKRYSSDDLVTSRSNESKHSLANSNGK